MDDLSSDDIRAAVAAGVISEAQATQVLTVSQNRQGFRTNMSDDDEPFELFKGFSEIFVTVGLALLTSGVIAVSIALSNPLAIPLVAAVISVLFAWYFTLERRMTLPSIFLSVTFGLSVFALTALLIRSAGVALGAQNLLLYLVTSLGLFGYFRVFRVPFTMFLIGLCGIGATYSITGIIVPGVFLNEGFSGSISDYFDLGASPILAFTMLAFGLAAFIGGMAFDLKDPHRISRYAASAFWLHILAAPAIVNVVSVSLLAVGGVAGYILAAIALAFITLIALIIDRRSFLTAGIIYITLILGWVIQSTNLEGDWRITWTLLIMGAFITWLGAWWVPMRTRLMRALPDFPFKNQLPPYPEAK